MNRRAQVLLLAIAFDLYWTLVVLFRQRGVVLWLGLALVAWMRLKPPQRVYAIVLAMVGSVLDAAWVLAGLIRFDGGSLLPLWLIALWLMFACLWTVLMDKTVLSAGIWVPIAAVGGPAAYFIGERLGAIAFLAPTGRVLSWMALGWGGMMLFFHFFVKRRQ